MPTIKANSAMLPSFQLIEYFISVLFICKFHKDWIKITQAMLRTKLNMDFWHSRASNFKVNSVNLPVFELVRDFMSVQVICNFHKDSIETKQAMPRSRSNMAFFCTKWQVLPESMIRASQNSNLSEILDLSRLSASFIKFQ